MKETILIVDDDPQLRKSFIKLLKAEGYEALCASTGEGGVAAVKEAVPDLVIMDVRMPGMGGMEAFRIMHRFAPKLPVIIMTAFGDTETAIDAIKLGAFDYVLKPFEIPDILELVEKALRAGRFMLSQVEMNALPEKAAGEAIIGRSRQMQEIYKSIGRVAPTNTTVLIRGETGTGKELIARALYQHSLRGDRPFLVINCVAIPETLLESELFGYEKGAFTGASTRRIGKIEQACGGTVFLDEIGDMSYKIQAKILRLLQEKSIERLGGREPLPVDVRIVAATNRNLEKAVADGEFREDLYYRLNVVTITLPPLRKRKEDIPMLTDYFLKRMSREMGTANPGINEAARGVLEDYPWPGNVRELGNIVQKALIFNQGGPLGREDLNRGIGGEKDQESDPGESNRKEAETLIRDWIRNRLSSPSEGKQFECAMDHFAAILVREALTLTGGNRTRAAKLLGMSRPTLIARIEKHGITIGTKIN